MRIVCSVSYISQSCCTKLNSWTTPTTLKLNSRTTQTELKLNSCTTQTKLKLNSCTPQTKLKLNSCTTQTKLKLNSWTTQTKLKLNYCTTQTKLKLNSCTTQMVLLKLCKMFCKYWGNTWTTIKIKQTPLTAQNFITNLFFSSLKGQCHENCFQTETVGS